MERRRVPELRLAVVIPSRGLIHSRTIESVLREIDGHAWSLHMAHGRPIPDCFNEPIAAALDTDPTHVWIVEEDMHLPAGVLDELANVRAPFVAADYPVAPGVYTAQRDSAGAVMYVGTGCLLAEADALRAMLPFRADVAYMSDGTTVVGPDRSRYGGHDVHLGMTLYRAATPIHVIDTAASQWRVIRRATAGRNELGWHDIASL